MSRSIPLSERWRRFQPDWVRVLVGLNVAVFALSLVATRLLPGTAGSPFDPSFEALYFLGGLQPAKLLEGEVWRLLTATVLHVNLLHLLVNMLALWNLGPMARHLLGRHSFLSLYVSTGLVASLVSALRYVLPVVLGGGPWRESLELYELPGSVGASGALFGVFGFVFLVARKTPGAGAMARQLGFWLILNLIAGFTIVRVDNAAHIGGFVAGLGFAQLWFRNPRPGARGFLIGSKASMICAALYLAALLSIPWMSFGPDGRRARAYLDVRPVMLDAIDRDMTPRDLRDSIEFLDESAPSGSLVEVSALRGYLQLRIDSQGRRPSGFELPVTDYEAYDRWQEFLRDYIRSLGPAGMINFKR